MMPITGLGAYLLFLREWLVQVTCLVMEGFLEEQDLRLLQMCS